MRYPNLVLVVCFVLPIITEEVTPNEIDCNFQDNFCEWNKEEGWIFNADVPKIENNELYLYVREKGVYKPEINIIEGYNLNTFYTELWKGKDTTAFFHVQMGNNLQTECKFDTWREWLVCNNEEKLQIDDKIFITLTLENNGFVALRKNPEFDNCLESDCRNYLSNLGFIWNIPKLPPSNSDSDSYIVLNSEDNSVSIKSPEIATNTDTTVTLKYWLNSETPEYSPTLSVFVEKNNKLVKLLPLTKCEDKIQEIIFKAGYTVRVDGPYKIVFAGEARGLDKAGVAILEVKGKHSPIEDTVIQVFWPRDVKIIYEMFQFYGWEISGLFEKRDISVELRQGFKEGVIRSRWMKWRKGMEVKLQYQCTEPASLEIEMIDVDGNAVISKPYDIVPGDEWIDVTVALNEQVDEFMIGIRGLLRNEDAKLLVQNIRVMHQECKDDSIYEPFEDSFICKCKESGFYYDYKEEKCLEMLGECKDDSIYEPFEDSFICKCKESGFYYDYKEEKCLEMLGECKDDSIYEPFEDSFICKCKESGFYYDYKEEKRLEMLGECKDDSIYEPFEESFICKCKESGFYYDYKEEKCLEMLGECKDDSIYEPFEESFICKCKESGFYYDYKEEKCLEMLGECKDDSIYEPFEDSFICKCKESGFYYDYKEEKCLVILGECKDDSIYEPFEDSFICKCKESGFYYDYKEEKCLDKDKINSSCLLQKCPENKVCDLETLECKCKHNYRNKIDGDECEATTCTEGGQGYKHCKDKGENWDCELSGDNYNCSCKHGFREVNGTCEDICKHRIPKCNALTQVCRITNTGESTCECKSTLVPDGNSKCQVDIGADKTFIYGNFVIKNVYTSNEILDLEILTKYVDDAFKTFLGKNYISAEVTRFEVNHNDDLECFIVVETEGNAGDEFTTRIESPSIYIPTTDPNYVILPPNLVVLKSWLKKENFRKLTRCQETMDFSYCPMGTKCSENNVSYWCTCSEGYNQLTSFFSGKDKDKKYPTEICEDKNECLEPDTCPENAKCRNLPGTYECNCKSGFRKHDNKCVEICNPSPCDNGKCEVVEDNFFCRCNTGYIGRQCEDTDNEYKSLNAKAAIIGGVLGGLLCLVIIVVVILFYNLRKKQSRTRTITEGKDDK
ncbi:uncharacterized protein LOC143241668 [Tachypleus tridentatus]|uniref:uncharacterized protein LOC143241668 n=1 Tax=Tachypleus tridentatus TaxID=6853 RepID=UPI003FD1A360